MPRPPLNHDQVTEFRARLVTAALRLFAEGGYEAVSLRGLAQALGCSAAAPYRYFAGKRDILAAVRTAGFDRLARGQGNLLDGRLGAVEQVRCLARGYLDFARGEPQTFRVMFELAGLPTRATEEERAAEGRAWASLYGAVRRAAEEGALAGDPQIRAHLLRAALQGIASLELSGKPLPGSTASALVDAATTVLLSGPAPREGTAEPLPPRARSAPGGTGTRAAEWKVW